MSDFFNDVTVEVTELKPQYRTSDNLVTGWKFCITLSKQGHVREYEGTQEVEPAKEASSYTLAEVHDIIRLDHYRVVFQSQYESTVGVSEADKVFDESFKVSSLK